ncbi:helix-turn-helix domain-containing protein [Gracilimonas mengyeensis]|uniref:Transcriptional regulator, AlpA family n=1 Tax=Gracilimonas mengyeensis TaxID=1302730 RepID=A0A521EI83_9BACT|nr:helix-turn-helix domain-containing protein [Gracilimonas mengyeensis]SMO83615.1 transcriptional regulator, AlpA family [Gracilimonas mengyeensis]
MKTTELDERLSRIEDLLLSQKTVLNFDETAVYTGLSKSHLYKLTSTGGIPCYKPTGKKLYFDKEELDEWMLRNKKVSQDEIDDKAENFLLERGLS